jgi:hypothetical protein
MIDVIACAGTALSRPRPVSRKIRETGVKKSSLFERRSREFEDFSRMNVRFFE